MTLLNIIVLMLSIHALSITILVCKIIQWQGNIIRILEMIAKIENKKPGETKYESKWIKPENQESKKESRRK